jgi:hypothetical protein
MKRAFVLMVVLGVAAAWLSGCSPKKNTASQPAPTDMPSAHGEAGAGGSPSPPPSDAMSGVAVPPASASPTAAAGLTWTLPAGWTLEAPRAMRVATYAIPAVQGDAEGAECAVYYFGVGQGGGVDANLERWIGQFQPAKHSKRTAKKVGELPVSLADVSGTYTAHGGGMGQPQADKPGWRLLGAIAETPQGAVFFKLAGPEKTVAAASKSFEGLVGSLKKE